MVGAKLRLNAYFAFFSSTYPNNVGLNPKPAKSKKIFNILFPDLALVDTKTKFAAAEPDFFMVVVGWGGGKEKSFENI